MFVTASDEIDKSYEYIVFVGVYYNHPPRPSCYISGNMFRLLMSSSAVPVLKYRKYPLDPAVLKCSAMYSLSPSPSTASDDSGRCHGNAKSDRKFDREPDRESDRESDRKSDR